MVPWICRRPCRLSGFLSHVWILQIRMAVEMILLGFEIGTGKRIEIPETGHLAWFGQTQLSGKTTALEAIAFRGGLKAVAFITKQGEGGFLTGRTIPPYFSEPTNDEEQPLWRWVKSILEASQQRKLNFEEAWVIRACEEPRQAKTLAEVHANIRSLLQGESIAVAKGRGKKQKFIQKVTRKPVSGINAGVYTSLNAYFNIVMPQLARLPYTKKLELGPGLNVMNLQEYAMETQALVIRSVMEWIYQKEKNVRMILPECQDFIRQGTNSPVKMAAETYIRKGGANKNFMWFDSQDMAVVDKFALKACSIVGIGVQTEINEIDRTLASLFNRDLKTIDIARLKIGEFFVRTSEARVSKVYVMPAWCDSEIHAQEIAKGNLPVSSLREVLSGFKNSRKLVGRSLISREIDSTADDYSRKPAQDKPHQLLQLQTQESPDEDEETEPTHSNAIHEDDGSPVDRCERFSGSGSIPDSEKRPLSGAAIQSSGISDTSEISKESSADGETEKEKTQNLKQETINEKPGRSDHGEKVFDLSGEGQRDSEGILRDFSGRIQSSTEENYAEIQNQVGAIRNVPGSEGEYMQPEKTIADRVRKVFGLQMGEIRDTQMEHTEICELLIWYDRLNEAHDALVDRVRQLESSNGSKALPVNDSDRAASSAHTHNPSPAASNGLPLTAPQLAHIYKYVKECAANDPGILDLLTRRPELRVKIERQTIEMDDLSIIGRIARLLHDGYFKQPKNGPMVQKELKRRGCDQPTTNLYKPLNRLTEMGFLTLEPDGFQEVSEMKVMVVGSGG